MKASEFRKLIREEIKNIIAEASTQLPTSYDFNNPGDEWRNILTKAMTRFNAYPTNLKVKKDTINLFTTIYQLGFKKIGPQWDRRKNDAGDLADNLIKYDIHDTMKKSVDDVITYIKNDIDPEAVPNWASYHAHRGFKAGKMVRITPQTKLKVGDKLVHMKGVVFADIVKIQGDKFILHFDPEYADDKPNIKTRAKLEDYYLLRKKR